MVSFIPFIVILIQCTFAILEPRLGRYDIEKPTNEMIADAGYPVENHYVTTPDGYIICVHRIPRGKHGKAKKKVALLHHGILASSADWVLFGPGNSLAYILADEGYDVWMSNGRGNIYSRNHTLLDPDLDNLFWHYSWHEMGIFDITSTIDYILDVTGVDGVYYAGHSEGTTIFYVMCSERPEYNKKIKVQVSLAPIAYMGHLTSPSIRMIVPFQVPFQLLLNVIGVHEDMMSGSGINFELVEEFCSVATGRLICQNLLFSVFGFHVRGMNLTRVPLIMGHVPAGASTKQIIHYGQEINSCHFRKYDYGVGGNMEFYGRLEPPDYDLSKVTAPVYLMYSQNDWMAEVKDVERLYEELGNPIGKDLIGDEYFNHLDFTYGDEAPELVYKQLLKVFSMY